MQFTLLSFEVQHYQNICHDMWAIRKAMVVYGASNDKTINREVMVPMEMHERMTNFINH